MNPLNFNDGARCREIGGDMWFPEPGVATGYAVDWAIQICKSCPLQQPCAEWGIKHELHGIWGGLTHTDRMKIRRERGITIHSLTIEQFIGLRNISAA